MTQSLACEKRGKSRNSEKSGRDINVKMRGKTCSRSRVGNDFSKQQEKHEGNAKREKTKTEMYLSGRTSEQVIGRSLVGLTFIQLFLTFQWHDFIFQTSTSVQLWWVFVEMDAASTMLVATLAIVSRDTQQHLIKPDAEVSIMLIPCIRPTKMCQVDSVRDARVSLTNVCLRQRFQVDIICCHPT